MAEDRYDIPDIPDVPGDDGSGGGGSGGRGGGGRTRKRWPWLLAGVALGVAGVLLLPRYLGPYLPDVLGIEKTEIRGQVVESERQEERLLLTVDSRQGALLVTFRQKVDEISLLVAEGDSVFLQASEFAPFLENPELVGVRKGRWDVRPGPAGIDTGQDARTGQVPGGARDAGAADTGAGPADEAGAAADTPSADAGVPEASGADTAGGGPR